jgi:hypothetical protein
MSARPRSRVRLSSNFLQLSISCRVLRTAAQTGSMVSEKQPVTTFHLPYESNVRFGAPNYVMLPKTEISYRSFLQPRLGSSIPPKTHLNPTPNTTLHTVFSKKISLPAFQSSPASYPSLQFPLKCWLLMRNSLISYLFSAPLPVFKFAISSIQDGSSMLTPGVEGLNWLRGKWLSDMDSNHDKSLQRALCYRYTIGQLHGRKCPPPNYR